MYKNILLATELGEQNRYVEDKAAAIQKLTNSKLSIIHVIEPIPSAYYTGAELGLNDSYVETTEILEKNANKLLLPIIERLNIPESNMVIATGKVSKEILLYAEKRDVDLIVIGSHGRHGLQLLLGSTANAVLHGAKCDVLAVRFQ